MTMRKKNKFTKQELDKFRRIINNQITETKEIIDQNLERSAQSVSVSSGDNHQEEMGSDNQAREFDHYIAQREGKFITNLEEALARIDNKTYGICRSCGVLINKKRLEIVPHATLCIDCKKNQK